MVKTWRGMAGLAWWIISIFIAAPLWAQDSTDSSQPASLYLSQIQGFVKVVSGGVTQKGVPSQSLSEQDHIVTGKNSKAYLEFINGGIVEVGPSTDVTVTTLEITGDDFKAKFLLAWGKLKAKVQKLTTSSSSFEIQAGGVVAGVRGTVFGVNYDPAQKQVAAQTFEGTIYTQVGGKEQLVNKGMSMLIGKTGIPLLGSMTSSDIASFQSFNDFAGQLIEKQKTKMLNDAREKTKIHTGILPEKQENDLNNTLQKALPF